MTLNHSVDCYHYCKHTVHPFTVDFFSVGEEDEVSVEEAVEMIASGLDLKGEVHPSFEHSQMTLHPVPIDQFIICMH